MLKNRFQILSQNFTSEQKLINTLWQEIETKYTKPTRHYHTLKHLEHIYNEIPTLDHISEFAIFYHDIIYDTSRKDNEEQSALLCQNRLTLLGVNHKLIDNTLKLILKTKNHKASLKREALFLDADLAILGSNQEQYHQYLQNIQKEYAIYSENLYKEGRKKVLKNFLAKERIYLSDHFYELYERQARKNLEWELTLS